MKYILTFLIVILSLSCSTFNPRYSVGSKVELTELIDSVQTADGISIPDTSQWIKSHLISNVGVIKSYLYYSKIDKRSYILSITNVDSIYHYNYRVE